mgnify:CR=1 FL=1|jgi:hypothetical protein
MRCQHSEECSSKREPWGIDTQMGSSNTAAEAQGTLSEKADGPIPRERSSSGHRSCYSLEVADTRWLWAFEVDSIRNTTLFSRDSESSWSDHQQS